jgi:hypothetical protein
MRALPGFAVALLLAGCSSDPNGPDNGVLVGRFGNADQHAELVALHEAAELQLICGSYFAFPGPVRLAADLTFRESGKYYQSGFGIPSGPIDAVAVGSYETSTGTVRMHLEMNGDDPFPYELHSGESGELDKVVCALSVQSR